MAWNTLNLQKDGQDDSSIPVGEGNEKGGMGKSA